MEVEHRCCALVCAGKHGDALYLDPLVATCKLSGFFVRSEVLGKSFEGGKPVMLVESLGEKVVMSAFGFQS